MFELHILPKWKQNEIQPKMLAPFSGFHEQFLFFKDWCIIIYNESDSLFMPAGSICEFKGSLENNHIGMLYSDGIQLGQIKSICENKCYLWDRVLPYQS